MLIKGYVVPLRAEGLGSRTSKCAIKSLDNSNLRLTYTYRVGLESLHTVINAIVCVAVTINFRSYLQTSELVICLKIGYLISASLKR